MFARFFSSRVRGISLIWLLDVRGMVLVSEGFSLIFRDLVVVGEGEQFFEFGVFLGVVLGSRETVSFRLCCRRCVDLKSV